MALGQRRCLALDSREKWSIAAAGGLEAQRRGAPLLLRGLEQRRYLSRERENRGGRCWWFWSRLLFIPLIVSCSKEKGKIGVQ